jgi:DNA-binding transcriptional ArsR family regulator
LHGVAEAVITPDEHAPILDGRTTVSKHLQVLFNAGLVDRRRSASAVIYSADAVHLDRILVLMSKEQRQRKRIDSAHDTHTIRSWKRSR